MNFSSVALGEFDGLAIEELDGKRSQSAVKSITILVSQGRCQSVCWLPSF